MAKIKSIQAVKPLTFVETLKVRLDNEHKTLADFAAQVIERPASILNGCERAFLGAARVVVYQEVLDSLADAEQKGETETSRLEFLATSYEREALSAAESPRRCTDPTSNIYHQHLASVFAATARDIRHNLLRRQES